MRMSLWMLLYSSESALPFCFCGFPLYKLYTWVPLNRECSILGRVGSDGKPRAQTFRQHSCSGSWDCWLGAACLWYCLSFSLHFVLHIRHLPHPSPDPGRDVNTSDRPRAIIGLQLWKKWVWYREEMGNLHCVGCAKSTEPRLPNAVHAAVIAQQW